MRDDQRQRVYDAESSVRRRLDAAARGVRKAVVAGSELTLPLPLRFGSIDAARSYLDALARAHWFAEDFPYAARRPMRLRRRKGDRQAQYVYPDTIAVHEPAYGSGWQMTELVLLHEVAHHATAHDHGGGPAHGPAFAAVLLRLVTAAAGPEAGLLLQVAYADHSVRFRPVP
jgi:putative metallohydrolase (TIGR04338 family)